jgi:hypothetical protein
MNTAINNVKDLFKSVNCGFTSFDDNGNGLVLKNTGVEIHDLSFIEGTLTAETSSGYIPDLEEFLKDEDDWTTIENKLQEQVEDYKSRREGMFIDPDEVEEMLGEYYDFADFDDETWQEIDKEVKNLCESRGVSPTEDYEKYARICDIAVNKVLRNK